MAKEKASEYARLYPSTLKRIKRMALNECSIAEAVDRLSKTGTITKEKPESKAKVSGVLVSVKRGEKVETKEKVTPSKYFVSRDGLYVWSDFAERILSKASETKKGIVFKLNSFDLKEDAVDDKIESALPKNHLFSETKVCAVVASLIEKQPKGKDGILQNNGRANLFYTKDFVVGVRWRSVGGCWRVDTWQRDARAWHAGSRVFSPATDLA